MHFSLFLFSLLLLLLNLKLEEINAIDKVYIKIITRQNMYSLNYETCKLFTILFCFFFKFIFCSKTFSNKKKQNLGHKSINLNTFLHKNSITGM